MFAGVGDRLIIKGMHLDEPVRAGEIIEIKHPDGSPPYLVRWEDTGRESLMFPGPDAVVHHFTHVQDPSDELARQGCSPAPSRQPSSSGPTPAVAVLPEAPSS